jgi:O-antigen/teichoic acid export membrane protein
VNTNISKNILFTSISNVLPSIFTFVFWLVTARIAGAEAIGLVSAIASFTIIVASIDVLDMSLGMKRQLGIAISLGDFGRFKQILSSTIIFVAMMVVFSTVLLLIPNLRILEAINIDRQYIWIIIPMIAAWAFQHVFSEALVAALQSKKLIIPMLLGVLSRFPILIVAIYLFNAPGIETLLAYSSFLFISTTIYSVYIIEIFRKTSVRAIQNFRSNIKLVLSAGLASWIPHMISILGSQLAIISVFSIEGAVEGGKFYLPMAIYTLTLFIVVGINRVSHPLIAGMGAIKQQTDFLAYNMKVAFMFTMPIAASLLFFPSEFLGFMGNEFSSEASTLSIFMVSVPFSIISEMVYYFMYGRGKNKTVLRLGLASNVPRIILYFLMVPLFGSTGAALAYLVGTLASFVLSTRIIRDLSLIRNYQNYMVLTAIPLAIGLATWSIDLQYVISTIIILFGSLLAFIRLGLFRSTELRNILYTGLPKKTAEKVYPRLSKIMDRIS